jgi:hypothetical protein
LFKPEEIVELPSYGEVITTDLVLEKVSEIIIERLSFEPDFYDGEHIKLQHAEEVLIGLRQVIKNI